MLSIEVSSSIDDNKINLLYLDTGMNLPDAKSDGFFYSPFPACQLLY